jgi:hypothetical protein
MRRESIELTFKLHLLAFVLALALVWYSLNPAPAPVIGREREAMPPDEKKRNVEQKRLSVTLPATFKSTRERAEPLPFPDEDDFEWLEFIDG